MRKSVVLMLVLVLLAASSLMMAKPVFSSVDVAENTWLSKTPMQQARGGLGVAVVNGKIYAIGGSTASGSYPPDVFSGGFVGTNEMYDPETDTWTYKASMLTPRSDFAIAAYGNKIYCIGGAVGFTVDEKTGFHSSVVSGVNEVYDTVTDTWETKIPMPDSRRLMQAHVVNGKIYVMDGSMVYAYDPDTDLWATKTRMPEPYPKWDSWPMSAVVDDKIIVTFEYSPLSGSSEQKIVIYDPETDSWSGGRSGSTIVALGAAAPTIGVKAPKKVYVFGVTWTWAAQSQMSGQVYDFEADVWENATAMDVYRVDFGVAVVTDVLYVIGGYIRGSHDLMPTSVNEQYVPIGYGVPPEIKVLSPVSQTYDVSNVSLMFTVNKTVGWVGYSLDGLDNVTIAGNTTIRGLANGLHNVTVCAEDSFGNMGASETVRFSVEVPFPTAIVATVSVASVIIAGVGLLFYFKKRKR
jgi:outer membrane lipoprotein-sorting protein